MFSPRLAIASLSGESDAEWARAASPLVGAAFLGGIAVDETARGAARQMVRDRDRKEFLPSDPVGFIASEFVALREYSLRPAINVRTTSVDPLRAVAQVCASEDAILEINAHCRQDEFCAVGCGESLLADTARLCTFVRVAAETGATVGVKVRAEVPGVDLRWTARNCNEAGASILHVDAMDSESVIRDVREEFDGFLIANNGVRDRESAVQYLGFGADAVSVARPSDNRSILADVRRAVNEWFQEVPRR